MNPQAKKLIIFFVAVLAVGVTIRFTLVNLAGVSAGPEAEILVELKTAEKDLPAIVVPVGKTLQPHAMQFGRLNVQVASERESAAVVCTLDLDGKVGDTQVSTLGWERIAFDRGSGNWAPTAGWAPRLSAALELLERRRVAIEQGQEAALRSMRADAQANASLGPSWPEWLALKNRRYRIEAWYLRSEPEVITVTEEWRLSGDATDRPWDERGRTSLTLVEFKGGFFFENGVL